LRLYEEIGAPCVVVPLATTSGGIMCIATRAPVYRDDDTQAAGYQDSTYFPAR
jgi:hypothetical protein